MPTPSSATGQLFDIEDFATQDGPGIRTVVFFKGCPLRCAWCANPESQTFQPDLMHAQARCQACGACVAACVQQAAQFDAAGQVQFDRALCAHCLERPCLEACLSNALKVVGADWDVEKLGDKIAVNGRYYRNSAGGVTLSGGEALAQPEFVERFLAVCERLGLAVGVETCGMFAWARVAHFVAQFEFIYYDIKLLDPVAHQHFTGQGNQVILANLEKLSRAVAPEKIIVSVPVIPGVNDRLAILQDILALCQRLGLTSLRLLPYHTLGQEKYRDLGRAYPMPATSALPRELLAEFQQQVVASGLRCVIEGF